MRTLPTAPASHPAAVAAAQQDAAPIPPPPAAWDGQEVLGTPETAQVAYAAWSGDPAVVVPSPPGAGKTRLVVLLAAYLAHRAGMRVGVAAQTREHAVQIARRAGQATPRAMLLWPAKDRSRAVGPTRVVSGRHARFPADGGAILIATTARWLYAKPAELGCDIMIADEAWQASYADLGALGAFAAQVICIGDPGQIAPVITGNTGRWQHSPRGPHLPSPAALIAAHGDAVNVIALRHTWRPGPATTALLQPAFYPGLPFTSRRPAEVLTGPHGLIPELAHTAVTPTAGHVGVIEPSSTPSSARASLASASTRASAAASS